MMRLHLATLLACTIAACTPSATPSHQGSSSAAWLTTARVAGAAPGDVQRVGVRVGAFTNVAVHVLPSATCVMRSEASDPEDAERGMRFYSSATGLVRFNTRSHIEGDSATVRFDCTGAGGVHAAYAVELRGDSAAGRESEPLDSSTYTLRPALEGDLTALSDEQIAAGHYPPRPDRASRPDAYEHWAALVSRPSKRITSGRVPVPDHRYGSTTPYLDSDGWSGAVVEPSTTGLPPTCPNLPLSQGAPACLPMTLVSASWVIPEVTPDPNGGNPAGDEGQRVSIFVGLSGWNTPQLLQSGVSLDTSIVSGNGTIIVEVAYNYAFVESYPAAAQLLFDSIMPGDTIFAEVWPCVAGSDALNLQGSYTCWEVEDETSGVFSGGQTVSGSMPFTGASAEWIVEQPTETACQPCSLSLANFGSVEFRNMSAYELVYQGEGKPMLNSPVDLTRAQAIRMVDSKNTVQALPFPDPSTQSMEIDWAAFQ